MKRHVGASTRRSIILLVILILIGGIGKITVFFMVQAVDPERILLPDSASYVETARAFLQTGRFAVSPDMPDVPQIERTPGYPFFIASIFSLFGERFPPLMLTQILISLGTIIVTYFIAATFWGPHIAIVPAVLLSLDMLSFVYSQQVMTETLFTFVLNLAVLTGIACLKESKHPGPWIFLRATFFSLATLIRPIAYYVVFPLMILFLFTWKVCYGWQWKKVSVMILVFFTPWILLVGGWQLRNYVVVGSAEVSCIQGVNLLFYRGAGIVAQQDGITLEEAMNRLGYDQYTHLKSHAETAGRILAQFSQTWKREGLRLIRQYPWLFIKEQAKGAFRMMFETDWNVFLAYLVGEYKATSGPGGDFLKLPLDRYVQKWVLGKPHYFMLFFIAASYLLVLYVGLIVSIWQEIRTRSNLLITHAFIWTIIMYFIVFSAGPEAYSRFRIPILPLLSIYAGYGVYLLVTRLIRNRTLMTLMTLIYTDSFLFFYS